MPSNIDTTKRRQIAQSLTDREYRDALVQESINQGIAFQIRANRVTRGLTQADLARRTGKAQPEISRLEDPDYEGYTLKTLSRIAAAFDVALSVRFIPYSELVDHMVYDRDFAVPSFDNDPGLALQARPEIGIQSRLQFTTAGLSKPTNVISFSAYIGRPGASSAAVITTMTVDGTSPEQNQWQTPRLAAAL